MDLYELPKEIRKVNARNGWCDVLPKSWNEKFIVPAKLFQIVVEVVEAFREWEKENLENFVEELADVVIRAIDLAESLGLPIIDPMLKKIEKNKSRPWKHGGKRI
jgi:NTP pyrophosphatase (non-canonical NTP hydrolase)